MLMTGFENKLHAAYQHGRIDSRYGLPCKPETPLVVYGDLGELQRNIIMLAWVDGWLKEDRHKGDGNG